MHRMHFPYISRQVGGLHTFNVNVFGELTVKKIKIKKRLNVQ